MNIELVGSRRSRFLFNNYLCQAIKSLATLSDLFVSCFQFFQFFSHSMPLLVEDLDLYVLDVQQDIDWRGFFTFNELKNSGFEIELEVDKILRIMLIDDLRIVWSLNWLKNNVHIWGIRIRPALVLHNLRSL